MLVANHTYIVCRYSNINSQLVLKETDLNKQREALKLKDEGFKDNKGSTFELVRQTKCLHLEGVIFAFVRAALNPALYV